MHIYIYIYIYIERERDREIVSAISFATQASDCGTALGDRSHRVGPAARLQRSNSSRVASRSARQPASQGDCQTQQTSPLRFVLKRARTEYDTELTSSAS